MDNPKKLFNFLHSFNDTLLPNYYRNNGVINFEASIPLSTTCLINYYINKNIIFEVNLYNKKPYMLTEDFLELFHLIYLNYSLDIDETKKYKEYLKLPDTFYLLPEGIKELNLEDKDNHSFGDKTIIKNIQNDLFNKDVIMPSTLKVLKGDLFNHKPKGNVYLNEGLETLDVINLAFTDDEYVTIPSSVKEIIGVAPIYLSDYSFKKIVFNNFNFENRNVLINIFDIFLKNNLRFFMFGFELVFHYDDIDEDIIPKIDVSLYNKHIVEASENKEYRKRIIEDIVNNIEKKVQEKRGNSKKLEK